MSTSPSAADSIAGIAPVIDLAPAREQAERQAVADRIGAACERSGFFLIANHGVPDDLIARLFEQAREFFVLPIDEKHRQVGAVPGDPLHHGLDATGGAGRTRGLDTPQDLCEMFRADHHGEPELSGIERPTYPNRWPTSPPDFRDTALEYMRAMTGLRADLLDLFALALGEPGWFDGKIEQHNSLLGINHYPPQPPQQGQYRKGPHADYGTVSILARDDNPYGLQVQDSRDETWHDVPVVPGTLCVNIGDLMAALTRRRWVSSVHRVPAPPPDAYDTTRISIVYFGEVDPDMKIVPIGAEPSGEEPTASAFIRQRVAAAFA